MRLQRRLDRFLSRFADQQSTLFQSVEMPSAVLPVAIVGVDHSDDERATYWVGSNLSGVAGQFGTYRLEAVLGDIEVLWASIAGPGASISAELSQGFTTATALSSLPQSSYGPEGASHAHVLAANEGGILGQRFGQVLQNDTLLFPVRGMILERGRSLIVQSFAANVATVCGLGWRNVQGNP